MVRRVRAAQQMQTCWAATPTLTSLLDMMQAGDAVGRAGIAGSLDMVTCFSVTKWVHLNQGDEGLMALFRAVHTLLAPGGCFVLEPQPWRSYRNASKKKVGASAEPCGQ